MSDNPIFSYTKRDYEGSRQEGIAMIPILSKGQWTDMNATDPGIIIIDYLHALVDMMNYYQDHQALETFLSTAKERENIFRLAKTFSYAIQSAKGAQCNVTFTSFLTYDHPIKIPKYTSISTSSGINYLTKEDAYLPTRATQVIVPCTQGKLEEIRYVGTGISRYSNVENAKNQSVILSSENIDIDTITITDSANRVWSPVDYIVFSESSDRVYQVDLNPDDTVTIKFGDGDRGIVPTSTDSLTIRYIKTEASKGRVDAETLTILNSSIIDNGMLIDFRVSNYQASSGGNEIQSSESIRELAPGVIKAQDRAITISDFENLAKLVDGVADAKAYDINNSSSMLDQTLYHVVRVLIIPEDTDDSSISTVKENVTNYLSKRMIPPTNLQVTTPTYESIDITLKVKQGNSEVEGGLEYSIYSTVVEYFKNRSSNVGEPFNPLDLRVEVENISNVRYVTSITPSEIVEMSDEFSIATLGNLSITVE